MTVVAGKTGKVVLGTDFVAEISNWKFDIKVDTKDTTCFATGNDVTYKTYTNTLKDVSGSFDGRLDMEDTGQAALYSAVGGAAVSVSMYLDSTHYFAGSVAINGCSIGTDVGDVVTVNYTWQSSGDITYT
jgi:hypothetical protein